MTIQEKKRRERERSEEEEGWREKEEGMIAEAARYGLAGGDERISWRTDKTGIALECFGGRSGREGCYGMSLDDVSNPFGRKKNDSWMT